MGLINKTVYLGCVLPQALYPYFVETADGPKLAKCTTTNQWSLHNIVTYAQITSQIGRQARADKWQKNRWNIPDFLLM